MTRGTMWRVGFVALAAVIGTAIAISLLGGSLPAKADEVHGAHYEGTIDGDGSGVVGSISFDVPWEESAWAGIVVSNVKGTCATYDTCWCFFTSPQPNGWWAQFDGEAHTFRVHSDYDNGGFEYIDGTFPGYATAEGTLSLSQGVISGSGPACASGERHWTAHVTSWPTATPTHSPSPTPTGSIEPTETEHTGTPTQTPTATPTETPTATPTPTGQTPSPTESASPTPFTPTPTPIPAESVAGNVDAGGTVTTDTEGDGTTPADPVETWVTSPNAGTVTIDEAAISGQAPAGFQFLGQDIAITAPGATTGSPLTIAIQVDKSLLPPGETADTIGIYKNGVLVPPCSGSPGMASPDPCVSNRQSAAGDDVRITIVTSSASRWNTGLVARGNVDCDSNLDPADALAVLRYMAGFTPPSCIYVADVNCDGQTGAVDLLAILRYAVGLQELSIPAGCPAIG